VRESVDAVVDRAAALGYSRPHRPKRNPHSRRFWLEDAAELVAIA
jgi:hypothetical protein